MDPHIEMEETLSRKKLMKQLNECERLGYTTWADTYDLDDYQWTVVVDLDHKHRMEDVMDMIREFYCVTRVDSYSNAIHIFFVL